MLRVPIIFEEIRITNIDRVLTMCKVRVDCVFLKQSSVPTRQGIYNFINMSQVRWSVYA